MNRKVLLFGSVFAIVIIVLASLPSVVGYQTANSTLNERIEILKHLKNKGIDSGWYPGFLISWFNYWMVVFIDAIIRGEWFPGLIVFFMILDVLFFLWSLLQGGGPDTLLKRTYGV